MATIDVKIPAIGDYKDVPIIEVLVKPGEAVNADQALMTLESEKATMDIPSPSAGVVRDLRVKVGDRVGEGAVVLTLETSAAAPAKDGAAKPAAAAPPPSPAPAPAAEAPPPPPTPRAEARPDEAGPQRAVGGAGNPERERPSTSSGQAPAHETAPRPKAHASPSIRHLARELGVDVTRVEGSGPRGRVLKEDVQRYVKESLAALSSGRGGAGLDLLPWPKVDFAKYGPVERVPLSRIKKLSAQNLSRNWVLIPHVTQHDEADITELEAFRVRLNEERGKDGPKVTLLAFLLKACVAALKKYPELNASLDGDGLVLKRYYHLGFAADTPNGLVVPVVRDADRKGVLELAAELSALAAKARDGKLGPGDMTGGTFSLSSLGGIGGTAFTPIINAPEVAILGVSRSQTKPLWDGKVFQPRLVLPLSLSYDHRVVDGALAARFTTFLAGVLQDFRRAML